MKKRKLKKGVLFIIFLFLVLIYALFIYFIAGFNINNIYVYDNHYLTDQEVIDLANLSNYPNYYTFSTSSAIKKIKSNVLIKDVKIKKRFFKQVHIYIEEYKIILKVDDKYVLENGEEVSLTNDNYNIPILINYVPNTKMDSLISKMSEIDDAIFTKISEIKYDPTEVDEDRFLVYMNDENYVYLTLTKFDIINKYNEALEQLEGKKGILYLDSGNYFKIKD